VAEGLKAHAWRAC